MTASEKIQSAIAIFIALLALVISIWQGFEQRKHNRLSVKPLLTFDKFTDDNEREITLHNNGLGPAIIEDFILRDSSGTYASSKQNLSYVPLMNVRGLADSILMNYYFDSGDVVNFGESFPLLKWKIKDHRNLKIEITIKYKSIYNEQFEVTADF